MKTKQRVAAGAVAAAVLLGLGGCADMSTQDRNTAIGAGVGAVGGSVLSGGSALGTIGGAAVGGVISHEVSKRQKVTGRTIMKKPMQWSRSSSRSCWPPLFGCAETPQHEGTGAYFDDSVVTTKVKAAIFNEPSLKSFEINVETYKGTVQLSGFVSARSEIDTATNVARRVEGVRSVKNDIRVR